MAGPDQGASDVICLVGPKASGKSSLLFSWLRSFSMRSHGFEKAGILGLNAIDPQDAQTRGMKMSHFLGAVGGKFNEEAAKFAKEVPETIETKSYFFELIRSGADKRTIEIVDSAGELLVPSLTGKKQVNEVALGKLLEGLEKASTVIVAMPMVNLEQSAEFGAIQTLVVNLTNVERMPKLMRLVLAFTHCERRFIHLGNQAFRAAASPDTVKSEIRKHFDGIAWRGRVEEFADQPGRQVFLTASGSLGFLAGNGTVNINPHHLSPPKKLDAAQPSDASQASTTDKLSSNESKALLYQEVKFELPWASAAHWRPFLTADPFLCAILGQPGAYAVELAGQQSSVRPKPGGEGKKAAPEPDKVKQPGLTRRFGKWLKNAVTTE